MFHWTNAFVSFILGDLNVQNQIKRALSKPEAIEYVRLLLEGDEFFTRTALAEVVCEEFGFQDPRGKDQIGGCLKGLRELEAKGWFQLPEPEIQKGGPAPRRLSGPVAKPEAVPAEVGDVRGLELILVEQESQMQHRERTDDRGTSAGSRAVGRQADPLSGRLRTRLAGIDRGRPVLALHFDQVDHK